MQVQLLDGIRSDETGFESAAIELDGDQWVLKEIYGQFADISTAYLGDRIIFDEDGLTGLTNNPVDVDIIQDPLSYLATNGTWLFGLDNSEPLVEVIRKYDVETGEEVTTGGWPKAAASYSGPFAADENWLFGLDSLGRLVKINISTGVNVSGGGWPKTLPGFPSTITTDGTWIIYCDGDLRKYAVSNGVEDTTGNWPVLAAFPPYYAAHTANSEWVFANDGETETIQKLSVADATEEISDNWPIPNISFVFAIGANDTSLFIDNNSSVEKYRIEDGEQYLSDGWPYPHLILGLAVSNEWMFTQQDFTSVTKSNLLEEYESLRVSSIDGSVHSKKIDTSILTARHVTTEGLVAPSRNLTVFSTRAVRGATQNIANNVEQNVLFDTFAGSGKSTPYYYFDSSLREFVITENGLYRIEAGLSWPTNATGFRILRLRVNGSVVTGSMTGQSPAFLFTQNASYTISMSAGATVGLGGHQNSGGSLDISNSGTFMTITRLGTVEA
jgi:hypothetical protein